MLEIGNVCQKLKILLEVKTSLKSNLTNTQNILRIANTKFELGKLSKNEILQLQLELLNAQKAVGVAKRNIEIATLALRSYIGYDGNNAFIRYPSIRQVSSLSNIQRSFSPLAATQSYSRVYTHVGLSTYSGTNSPIFGPHYLHRRHKGIFTSIFQNISNVAERPRLNFQA